MGLNIDNIHEKNLSLKERCSPLIKEMQISVVSNADMGLNLINFKRRNYQCGDSSEFKEMVHISVEVYTDINT